MLSELFISEGRSIFTFKPGDIITRVKPAEIKKPIHNENLGISTEVVDYTDGSYRGRELEYLGIANNMIYVREFGRTIALEIEKFGRTIAFEIEKFEEGWDLYQTPPGN